MLDTVMHLEREFDVLIVDDGSPDGTAEVVRDKMNAFPGRIHLEERTGKLGLGTAYIHGFKWALARHYEYVFEMDCDFSHDPKDLSRLHDACKDGADLSIGSRYVKGVNVVNWPMSRVLLSYFASVYVRFITGMPIQDSTAGFKCYKRSTLEKINFDKIHFVGYAFQIEMKFKVWQRKLNIVEVPVIFTDRTEGTSKMSSGIIKEAIFGVIKLKLWSLFQKNS
jgi:dolichol-phosphate mannosyltransferase